MNLAPCRFCPKNNDELDKYTVDTILPPKSTSPYESQGIQQRQCSDSQKIINTQDCSRYMECLNGEWFSVACPKDHYFDAKQQKCQAGVGINACRGQLGTGDKSSSIYLQPLHPHNSGGS